MMLEWTDSAEDAFCEYFSTLRLLNRINGWPWSISLTQLETSTARDIEDAKVSELKELAARTSLDQATFSSLLAQRITGQGSAPEAKLSWRDIDKWASLPAKPNPLQEFVAGHVDEMYEIVGRIPREIEKSKAALKGLVRSGFEGYPGEIFEAYSFYKEEVTSEELKRIVSSWKAERENYIKWQNYPDSMKSPTVFWNSSRHFVEEGVARYRFKSSFGIGAFDSTFAEFETSLAEGITSLIVGLEIRHLAYDLTFISRSTELANKLRVPVANALATLVAEQKRPFWSERSINAERMPVDVPSVGTTTLAALSLVKLAQSDKHRESATEAAAWLLEKQNSDGSWSLDFDGAQGLESRPDVHITIAAMEVIFRSRVPGASHHLDHARDWLIAKQDKNGLWEDETFCLPQPTVLILETLEYLGSQPSESVNEYLTASVGYFKRALAFAEEQDETARRLAVVTAHLGMECFLYSLLQFKNVTKVIEKGESIGMRKALSAFQGWLQQNQKLKHNEILPYSNELTRLAYIRDEVVHKAISVGAKEAAAAVLASTRFASEYSKQICGFDCLR